MTLGIILGVRVESQEQRRQERRRFIAIACHERLAAESQPTLEDLARDAGLSRQNLLFYFKDKTDLWAEAVVTAAEAIFPVLQRLVEGEVGFPAIRALRRAVDEIQRVLPAPFAIWLDGVPLPGASPLQRARAVGRQSSFLEAFARVLSAPKAPGVATQRFARFAWQALQSPHREARIHARSGLVPPPSLAADLDWTEAQLVLLARNLLR